MFIKAFEKLLRHIINYLLTGLLSPCLEMESPYFMHSPCRLGHCRKIRLRISSPQGKEEGYLNVT